MVGSDDRQVVASLYAVSKSFAGVKALDRVSLELRQGEVHSLLGENGAGKSTLISLLAGMQHPDSGVMHIAGALANFRSPANSLERGIGVVYQHPTLVQSMTVLENMMLGDRAGVRHNRRSAAQRLAVLGRRLGVRFNSDALVKNLSLGEQQLLEIVRAMWRGARVLVLDEPTSLLAPHAIKALLSTVRALAENGMAVLFVTHKLSEVQALSGPITVLRAGRVAMHMSEEERQIIGEDPARTRMFAAMFGAAAKVAPSPRSRLTASEPTHVTRTGTPTLLVDRASTVAGDGGARLREVSFAVWPGEVFGIAGIDGEGQQHLAEAISGQRALSRGRISFLGEHIDRLSVRARQRRGIGYVTDDRAGEGIVGGLSVALNLALKSVGEWPLWRKGVTNRGAVQRLARLQIAEHDIRPGDPLQPAGQLSGGNIQKLLLARELARDPRFIVFNKPCHGLDMQTVERVRQTVLDYRARGGSALLISNELDELTGLCDRIAVLSGGKVLAVLENDRNDVSGRAAALVSERLAELMTAGAEL